VVDGGDNCAQISNADQTDTDGDGLGNVCDTALYLIDNAEQHKAKIYHIDLDAAHHTANLKLVAQIPYDRAHIAISPDGRRIYAVKNGNVRLGYYDLVAGTFTDLGPLAVSSVTQAAFSPNGTLYIGNDQDNRIYTVNVTTRAVTEVGRVYKPNEKKVNINGADLVFTPDSILYDMTCKDGNKIYEIPAGATELVAARILDGPGVQATGLAFDPINPNLLLFSEQRLDKIIVINRISGAVVDQLKMRCNGLPFNHNTGDMTVWPITAH
jgi:hypothetical protein